MPVPNALGRAGLLAVGAVTLSLTFAACGAGGTVGEQPTGSTSKLTIAVGNPLTSLDSTKVYQHDQIGIEGLIDGYLTKINEEGTEATPGIAESWTTGPKAWTFTIRKDAKFSDGTAITATDVADSLNYARNKKDGVWTYAFSAITSVTAKGADKVEVGLAHPSPHLNLTLGIPGAPIFPAAKLADKANLQDFLNRPMSAGQYKIASQSPTKVVLKANPNYWGETPSISELTFLSVPDASARLSQLQGGQVNVADNIPVQAGKQLTGKLHADWDNAAIGGQYLAMNMRPGAPTANLKLREAVNTAIDRNALNQVVYLGQNKPQLGVFPEGSPFYLQDADPTADVAKAKALVKESGCGSSCKLSIGANVANPDQVQMAQLVAQQLEKVGIKVTVRQQDSNALQSDLEKGNFDLAISGALGVFVEDLINYVLPSDGGGPATWVGWKAGDKFVKKWQLESGDQYNQTIKQALEQVSKDKPFVALIGFGNLMGSDIPHSEFRLTGGQNYVVAPKK